jgi:hypothetical protein
MKKPLDLENDKHLKKNPFTVPDRYFAHLADGLKNIPQEHPQTKVRFLQNRYVRVFAFAATMALAFTIGWLSQATSAENEILSNEDIIALNENGYLPYTELDILMVLDDQDLDEWSESTTDVNTDYIESTQPDLVEDYYLTLENL